jgi:small subunit ribosomal protein S5
MSNWKPRTELGKMVAEGAITLEEIFSQGRKIKEAEIVDRLIPNLQSDIIFIGGSPGKGGGIKRTSTRRTARMHRSGRRYRVQAMVVVGNGDGYLGMGMGEAIENRDAIDKATEAAKLRIMPVKRGCGSWECACGQHHSLPFAIRGKAGSVRIELIPAPKGIGLCIGDEAKKIMRLAGIRDVWSKTEGESKTRNNYANAIFDAFKKTNTMKIEPKNTQTIEETIQEEEQAEPEDGTEPKEAE